WGPLAPGGSQSFTRARTLNVTSDLINTATATGTTGPGGTASVSAQDTTVVIPHRCEIALTKAPDVCEVQEGVATPVNYKYVISNLSDFFDVHNLKLVDDNGTPGSTFDDVTVCTPAPIPPLGSTDCSHTFTLSTSRTNVATASGVSGTASVTAPQVGCRPTAGNLLAGTDPFGRPIFPALFITDVTSNPSANGGDWQQDPGNNAKAQPPSRVCGTWKTASRNPTTGVITVGADP